MYLQANSYLEMLQKARELAREHAGTMSAPHKNLAYVFDRDNKFVARIRSGTP
jgi:hypothetical protein